MTSTGATTSTIAAPTLTRRRFVRGAIGGAAAAGGLLAAQAADAAPLRRPGAAAPAAIAAQEAQPGGELIYALTNKFDTLDPNVTTNTDVVRVAFHLFDPLVWQSNPGEFIPVLATSWEVNDTADQYTFTLRTDVTFHDGTPLNAEAVKFTFDRIVDPELKSQIAISLLGPYAGSEAPDPATLVVTFSKPYAPFLDSVSQPLLSPVSPTAVQELGPDFGSQPVGTGPFKFDSYEVDNQVRLVKNEAYNWAPAVFTHQGAPHLDAITFRIIPEPGTRLAALQSEEVHYIQDVPPQDYENLKGDESMTVLEGVVAGSPWMMMINVTRPPMDDVKLRQALSWGVDKEGMIQVVWRGLMQPACSPLTSVMFGYDPATCDVYTFDTERAGALLDEAGWTMGDDGIREKDGQKLSLGMYYRSDNADFTGMATFLQSMYPEIGVEIDLHGLAQAGYFDAVRAGEHHLQFWQETGTDPDILRVYFHSENADGGTNRNRYKNEEMDGLLEAAAGATDPEQRKALYSQIQMKALNEAIMVYFAETVNLFAYLKDKVQNPSLSWSGAYPFFYDATMAGS